MEEMTPFWGSTRAFSTVWMASEWVTFALAAGAFLLALGVYLTVKGG